MAGIIKKKKSAYGKRRKKKSKTYDTYMAAMAAPAEAAVDVDVPYVVVAAALVEVPPCCCVNIFTVLPPEDTSRPASWKTARTVHACDRSASKAAVDVDVPAVVVVAAVVEVPPAPASIFLRCCHRRILAAPRDEILLVWSRRVTARSPRRRPSG